jgi:hypothetical protein
MGASRKRLLWIFVITAAVWAFAINTGSDLRHEHRQGPDPGARRRPAAGVAHAAQAAPVVDLLQGSTASPEARREASTS